MDEFLDMASQLGEELHEIIDEFDIPIEQFEAAGHVGIIGFSEGCAPDEDSVAVTAICDQIGYVPIKVVKWLCFAAGYLAVATRAQEKSLPGAIVFLAQAEKHMGYVKGFAYGMCFEDESKKAKLALAGAQGAKGRDRNYKLLKQWVDVNWSATHGTSLDVARKLAKQLPPHLADKSKAPVRLIYDTIRAKATTK